MSIAIKLFSAVLALIIVDVRLFSAAETPSYHVAVGEIDFKNPEHVRAFEKHTWVPSLDLRSGDRAPQRAPTLGTPNSIRDASWTRMV